MINMYITMLRVKNKESPKIKVTFNFCEISHVNKYFGLKRLIIHIFFN